MYSMIGWYRFFVAGKVHVDAANNFGVCKKNLFQEQILAIAENTLISFWFSFSWESGSLTSPVLPGQAF